MNRPLHCPHVTQVDFKTRKVAKCTECKADSFHVYGASFDFDAESVDGQKSIRDLIISQELIEIVDIENWVNRFDAVIPHDQHNILNMKREVRVLGHTVVDLLRVEFLDPDLGRSVHQDAFLGEYSVPDLYDHLLEMGELNEELDPDDFQDGDVILFCDYVKKGRVDPRPKEYMMPKFANYEEGIRVMPIRKPGTDVEIREVCATCFITGEDCPAKHRVSESKGLQFNLLNVFLTLGIMTAISFMLYMTSHM